MSLLPVAIAAAMVAFAPVVGATDEAPAADGAAGPAFDPKQLFAGSCGWCHSKGGREAGKGPRLMGTSLSDEEIENRIRTGKPGQMPGFASTFDDRQLQAIVRYIRQLKPDGS